MKGENMKIKKILALLLAALIACSGSIIAYAEDAHSFENSEEVWVWEDDFSQATLTLTCTNDDCDESEGYQLSETDSEIEVSVKEATCTTAKKTTYTAEVEINGKKYSSKKEKKEGSMLGHDYVPVVTNPTCTQGGYTTYTCSRCQDSYTEDLVKKLGHNYVPVVTDPTCTQGGYTAYTCSRCTASYQDDTTDAKGHTPVTDEAVPATCSATGLTEGSHCSVCGEVLVAQQVVEKLAHTPITDEAVAPTCSATGLTEGSHCSVCGEVLVAQQVVNKVNHKYNAVVTEPTCTSAGYTTYTCIYNCGSSYTDNMVSMLGHNYESVVTEPTCTSVGFTTYTCSRCQNSYKDSYKDALGHNFGDWSVTTQAVAADCENAGATQIETRNCSRCEAKETKGGETIEALGHSFTNYVSDGNATCTEDGTKTAKCDRCEATDTIADEGSAKGHKYMPQAIAWDGENATTATATFVCENDANHTETEVAEVAKVLKSEADCENAAVYTYTASYEGFESISKDVSEGEALGHDYVAQKIEWDSETATTAKAVFVCSRNQEHTKTEVAEVAKVLKSEADCENAAVYTYTASYEGFESISKDVSEGEALGHDYVAQKIEWDSEAATTAKAVFVCSRNQEHTKTEAATVTSVEKTPATCTTPATHTYTASYEGLESISKEAPYGEALGHDFVEGECARCDAKDTFKSYTATVDKDIYLVGAKWSSNITLNIVYEHSTKTVTLTPNDIPGKSPVNFSSKGDPKNRVFLNNCTVVYENNTYKLPTIIITPKMQVYFKQDGESTYVLNKLESTKTLTKVIYVTKAKTKFEYTILLNNRKITYSSAAKGLFNDGPVNSSKRDTLVFTPNASFFKAASGNSDYSLTITGYDSKNKKYTTKIIFRYRPAIKLTAKSKAIGVSWSKISSVSGFQIQCATNSKFTKGKKTVTVSGGSSTAKNVTGLKKKTKYYVRVRAYTKKNGKTVYSNWSTVKNIKTK